MNQFTCIITERHRPDRVVDYTASIQMDEDCSIICTGFQDTATLEVCMSSIAEQALSAGLTFAHPINA